jgi:hypothetical protein
MTTPPLAQLLHITPPAPPHDFAAFWQARYQQALAVQPHPRLSHSGTHRAFEIYDLHYCGGVSSCATGLKRNASMRILVITDCEYSAGTSGRGSGSLTVPNYGLALRHRSRPSGTVHHQIATFIGHAEGSLSACIKSDEIAFYTIAENHTLLRHM